MLQEDVQDLLKFRVEEGLHRELEGHNLGQALDLKFRVHSQQFQGLVAVLDGKVVVVDDKGAEDLAEQGEDLGKVARKVPEDKPGQEVKCNNF